MGIVSCGVHYLRATSSRKYSVSILQMLIELAGVIYTLDFPQNRTRSLLQS